MANMIVKRFLAATPAELRLVAQDLNNAKTVWAGRVRQTNWGTFECPSEDWTVLPAGAASAALLGTILVNCKTLQFLTFSDLTGDSQLITAANAAEFVDTWGWLEEAFLILPCRIPFEQLAQKY